MTKRKRTKGQTIICKTLHRKLKIEQHEHFESPRWSLFQRVVCTKLDIYVFIFGARLVLTCLSGFVIFVLFPPMHWYFLFSCHVSYIYFSVRIVKYLRIGLNFFSVHEEINSKMWYTLCNPRSGLCKGVYHIFEFISNEPNKTLWSILID